MRTATARGQAGGLQESEWSIQVARVRYGGVIRKGFEEAAARIIPFHNSMMPPCKPENPARHVLCAWARRLSVVTARPTHVPPTVEGVRMVSMANLPGVIYPEDSFNGKERPEHRRPHRCHGDLRRDLCRGLIHGRVGHAWLGLAAASERLTAVMEKAAPWLPPMVYMAITLFAAGHSALVNHMTAPRLAYGMAHQELLST